MRRVVKLFLFFKVLLILNWFYYFNYYTSRSSSSGSSGPRENQAAALFVVESTPNHNRKSQLISVMATVQASSSVAKANTDFIINASLAHLNSSQLTQQLQQIMLAKNLKFFLFKSSAKEIYCSGQLLHTIQMSNVFIDSKTFVDMPTKYEHLTVLQNFKKLGTSPNKMEIEVFVKENFHPIGHDVTIVEPLDWHEKPTFLHGIRDQHVYEFGHFLNQKWKTLLRKQDKTKICPSCLTSVIETSNPFIVPGGRFIEYYYW